MKQKLILALATLTLVANDHWTKDGAPQLKYLSDQVGEPVKRKDVTSLVPLLTRDTLKAFEESEEEGKQDPRVPATPEDGTGTGGDNPKSGPSTDKDGEGPTDEELEAMEPLDRARHELAQAESEVSDWAAELRDTKASLAESQDKLSAAQALVEKLSPSVKPHEMHKAARDAGQADLAKKAARREASLDGNEIDEVLARREQSKRPTFNKSPKDD